MCHWSFPSLLYKTVGNAFAVTETSLNVKRENKLEILNKEQEKRKRMWPKAKEKNEVKHKVLMNAKDIVKKWEREEAQSAY